MIYPKFLKDNSVIGVTALSSGSSDELLDVKTSFNNLKKHFRLIVTPNVYGNVIVSSSKEERIKEFNELLDEDINLLTNIRGGEFLYETLDSLDFKKIVNKKIWVMGYSDPTSLLYILTTKYDLATIYGFNGKGFDSEILHPYQLNCFEIIKGNIIKQESFMDRNTISVNGNFKDSGMIIGGCLDVIRYLTGTSYDNTINFINKYKDKKIIWYFDIFEMSNIDLYITLLQLKNIGYFKYTNTIIFGTILFENINYEIPYIELIKKVFPDKNIIFNANIGHVHPSFTIINGSIAKVEYKDNKMILEMKLDK